MRGSLLILFGTQTGTAQDVAERVARDAVLRAFDVKLAGLDKYDAAYLPHEGKDLVIFVMSTTGDGDVPESAKPFWQILLRRDLPKDWLSGLKFTVFGCGDSRQGDEIEASVLEQGENCRFSAPPAATQSSTRLPGSSLRGLPSCRPLPPFRAASETSSPRWVLRGTWTSGCERFGPSSMWTCRPCLVPQPRGSRCSSAVASLSRCCLLDPRMACKRATPPRPGVRLRRERLRRRATITELGRGPFSLAPR